MGVELAFEVVRDLSSVDPSGYGGHPALKVPTLRTPDGTWFGALNICRELWRRSTRKPRVLWPEDLEAPLLANAQELVLQAMATEVSLIMSGLGGAADTAHAHKLRRSLEGTLGWLEERADAIHAALPRSRHPSFLEITAFCLLTHLEFRRVVPTAGWVKLGAFCGEVGRRSSARNTEYCFDP